MIRFFWDFFGPDALGTAQHYERHLKEFLTRHGGAELCTGILELGKTHAATWCDLPEPQPRENAETLGNTDDDLVHLVAKTLRPKRSSKV